MVSEAGVGEVDPMGSGTRSHSAKVKFRAVLELVKGEKSVVEVARAYQVHPNSLKLWKDRFLERGAEIFERDSPDQGYEKRIAELERLLGRKEVEIALLKNFLDRGT